MAAVLQCSIDDLVNNAPLRLTKLPPWLVPLLPDLATAPPHIRKTIKEIVKSSKAIPKGK
jgi:hypothetical protein